MSPEWAATHPPPGAVQRLAFRSGPGSYNAFELCFWTMVLEKTLENPLDCKEIQSVNPRGNKSWIFIGKTDVKAETPICWPPDAKSWLIWKDLDAGKDWRRKRGWHRMRWLDSIIDSMDMSLSKFQELLMDKEVLCTADHGVTKNWTWLSNWTELNWTEAPIKLLLLSWVPVHIKFLCVPFENEVLGNGRRWQKSKMGRSPASKKYIKKSSECGTTPTEQLLSNSRRPQTSKKESQSP